MAPKLAWQASSAGQPGLALSLNHTRTRCCNQFQARRAFISHHHHHEQTGSAVQPSCSLLFKLRLANHAILCVIYAVQNYYWPRQAGSAFMHSLFIARQALPAAATCWLDRHRPGIACRK